MEKIKVTMDGKVYEVDKFSAITEFVHAHMQEDKQKYVLATGSCASLESC